MIRRIIIEFVLPLLLFFIVRSMFSGRSSSPAQRRQPDDSASRVSPGGELKKDPVCGTYVSTAAGYNRKVGGETLYFCSAECRDRFQA